MSRNHGYSLAMNSRDFSFVQSYGGALVEAASAGEGRSTYNVFVVRVQIDAALLGVPPDFGDRLVLVGLVDDLGDDLRALFDQA